MTTKRKWAIPLWMAALLTLLGILYFWRTELYLSDTQLSRGDLLTFARPHSVPEDDSVLRVEETVETLTDGFTFQFKSVIKTKTIGKGVTCHGDSGAPLLDKYNRLVAVHSAGGRADCQGNEIEIAAYHSWISAVRPWINSQIGLQ